MEHEMVAVVPVLPGLFAVVCPTCPTQTGGIVEGSITPDLEQAAQWALEHLARFAALDILTCSGYGPGPTMLGLQRDAWAADEDEQHPDE